MTFRGGSRTAAISKMERVVIIVNGWKQLTIITKHSILDVVAALDPPLSLIGFRKKSVQRISAEYDVCEGEIKYDIMCPGNRSTINLDVYEKLSHLLKFNESTGENSRD